MADNSNYAVFAKLFKNHLCAVRADDTPEDPHRIYFDEAWNEQDEAINLEPTEFSAYIEQKEVVE